MDYKNPLFEKINISLSDSNTYNALVEVAFLTNSILQFDYKNKTISFLSKEDEKFEKNFVLSPSFNLQELDMTYSGESLYPLLFIEGGIDDRGQIVSLIPYFSYPEWIRIKKRVEAYFKGEVPVGGSASERARESIWKDFLIDSEVDVYSKKLGIKESDKDALEILNFIPYIDSFLLNLEYFNEGEISNENKEKLQRLIYEDLTLINLELQEKNVKNMLVYEKIFEIQNNIINQIDKIVGFDSEDLKIKNKDLESMFLEKGGRETEEKTASSIPFFSEQKIAGTNAVAKNVLSDGMVFTTIDSDEYGDLVAEEYQSWNPGINNGKISFGSEVVYADESASKTQHYQAVEIDEINEIDFSFIDSGSEKKITHGAKGETTNSVSAPPDKDGDINKWDIDVRYEEKTYTAKYDYEVNLNEENFKRNPFDTNRVKLELRGSPRYPTLKMEQSGLNEIPLFPSDLENIATKFWESSSSYIEYIPFQKVEFGKNSTKYNFFEKNNTKHIVTGNAGKKYKIPETVFGPTWTGIEDLDNTLIKVLSDTETITAKLGVIYFYSRSGDAITKNTTTFSIDTFDSITKQKWHFFSSTEFVYFIQGLVSGYPITRAVYFWKSGSVWDYSYTFSGDSIETVCAGYDYEPKIEVISINYPLTPAPNWGKYRIDLDRDTYFTYADKSLVQALLNTLLEEVVNRKYIGTSPHATVVEASNAFLNETAELGSRTNTFTISGRIWVPPNGWNTYNATIKIYISNESYKKAIFYEASTRNQNKLLPIVTKHIESGGFDNIKHSWLMSPRASFHNFFSFYDTYYGNTIIIQRTSSGPGGSVVLNLDIYRNDLSPISVSRNFLTSKKIWNAEVLKTINNDSIILWTKEEGIFRLQWDGASFNVYSGPYLNYTPIVLNLASISSNLFFTRKHIKNGVDYFYSELYKTSNSGVSKNNDIIFPEYINLDLNSQRSIIPFKNALFYNWDNELFLKIPLDSSTYNLGDMPSENSIPKMYAAYENINSAPFANYLTQDSLLYNFANGKATKYSYQKRLGKSEEIENNFFTNKQITKVALTYKKEGFNLLHYSTPYLELLSLYKGTDYLHELNYSYLRELYWFFEEKWTILEIETADEVEQEYNEKEIDAISSATGDAINFLEKDLLNLKGHFYLFNILEEYEKFLEEKETDFNLSINESSYIGRGILQTNKDIEITIPKNSGKLILVYEKRISEREREKENLEGLNKNFLFRRYYQEISSSSTEKTIVVPVEQNTTNNKIWTDFSFIKLINPLESNNENIPLTNYYLTNTNNTLKNYEEFDKYSGIKFIGSSEESKSVGYATIAGQLSLLQEKFEEKIWEFLEQYEEQKLIQYNESTYAELQKIKKEKEELWYEIKKDFGDILFEGYYINETENDSLSLFVQALENFKYHTKPSEEYSITYLDGSDLIGGNLDLIEVGDKIEIKQTKPDSPIQFKDKLQVTAVSRELRRFGDIQVEVSSVRRNSSIMEKLLSSISRK